jgi:hypothetical protein
LLECCQTLVFSALFLENGLFISIKFEV